MHGDALLRGGRSHRSHRKFEVSNLVILAPHGEVLTDILVLGAIPCVCRCDLAIGVPPVFDSVYLEYSTK